MVWTVFRLQLMSQAPTHYKTNVIATEDYAIGSYVWEKQVNTSGVIQTFVKGQNEIEGF